MAALSRERHNCSSKKVSASITETENNDTTARTKGEGWGKTSATTQKKQEQGSSTHELRQQFLLQPYAAGKSEKKSGGRKQGAGEAEDLEGHVSKGDLPLAMRHDQGRGGWTEQRGGQSEPVKSIYESARWHKRSNKGRASNSRARATSPPGNSKVHT